MFRVGLGHDTHRLGPDRPLILGGLRIEHPRGLIGHSDADVVLHALTDALLGAAGLGDIGDAYPDTDPRYKDCDSRLFVVETLKRLSEMGWRIVNIDLTLNVFSAAEAHRVKRLVFASSNWVMAGYRLGKQRLTTSLPPRPTNPYGCGKLFGERAGRNLSERTGISFIALRRTGLQRSRSPTLTSARSEKFCCGSTMQ